MEHQRGKQLISTKSSAAGRKTTQLICSIALYLVGICVIFSNDLFKEIARDLFGKSSLGWLLWFVALLFFFLYPTTMLIISHFGFKSYCNVYEYGIAGITALSISDPKAPMQKFDIGYDEILNVTEAGQTLRIYTQYTTYEVLAMKNRKEAVNLIRERMAGRNRAAKQPVSAPRHQP